MGCGGVCVCHGPLYVLLQFVSKRFLGLYLGLLLRIWCIVLALYAFMHVIFVVEHNLSVSAMSICLLHDEHMLKQDLYWS